MSQRMDGKTVVITGASSGLGLASVRALAAQGARIIAAVRDVDKLQAILGPTDQLTQIALCDLADMASIQRFAERLLASEKTIDVLINNAGVMNFRHIQTRDGFESNFGVNHLGHFLLTARLFPLLAAAPAARVVTVSSIAHRRGTLDFANADPAKDFGAPHSYANSKLANLVFSLELSRRLKQTHPHMAAVAAHPGWTHTPLFRDMSVTAWLSRFLAMDAESGAAPQIAAALDTSIPNGAYWGPNGFREIWGKPGPAAPSMQALDEGLAQILWQRSETWTQTPFKL